MYNGYPPNPSLGGVPPGWANGMSTSASPGAQNNPINHMNAMNPMSMMMSQLAMSNMMPNFMMSPTKPIGSAEDDILLVKTLKEAETTGMTYKQALDSLHSVRLLLTFTLVFPSNAAVFEAKRTHIRCVEGAHTPI